MIKVGYRKVNESINSKALKYIKNKAKDDAEYGNIMDPDDYQEFALICKEDGITPSKELFNKYFELCDEIRESINESSQMAEFEFKCSKCGLVFKDTYDYPLPTDCNAAVRCPKCNGIARITDKKKFKLVNESISFKDIQNAKYAASFMNDRADLTIDGLTYAKIGKNKWEHIPASPHAFGGTYTDEQIYDKVKNSKKCSLNESVDSMTNM